jgi:hypothetical protein
MKGLRSGRPARKNSDDYRRVSSGQPAAVNTCRTSVKGGSTGLKVISFFSGQTGRDGYNVPTQKQLAHFISPQKEELKNEKVAAAACGRHADRRLYLRVLQTQFALR